MASPAASTKSVWSARRGCGVLPPLICCASGNSCLPDSRITPTPPCPAAVAMAAMVGVDGDDIGLPETVKIKSNITQPQKAT